MQEDFAQYAEEVGRGLTEWGEPVPFSEATTPRFPVEALPGPIAEFVRELSVYNQTP